MKPSVPIIACRGQGEQPGVSELKSLGVKNLLLKPYDSNVPTDDARKIERTAKLKSVRILIADDHEAMREGVRLLIEREPGFEVCATARTGREAVEQARRLRPDVAVLDMSMPEMNGVEAARRIRRAVPQTEVVIFTAREDDENIREIFEAGVKSYILKSEATGHLVAAIKALSRHKPFFTDQVSAVLFRRFMSSSPRTTRESEQLSARELEIVLLLAQGKTNKETANGLGISLRTVEAHRANIMSRPGMSSLAAIVRYAVRHGIIDA